jgi:hypothetical protein
MKKFVFTTAVALVLATGAYAQGHHGMGGGGGGMGGGGMGAGAGVHGSSMGGGGPGPGLSGPRGPSGPGLGASRGPTSRGPTGGLYNYAPSRSAGTAYSGNHEQFTGRNERGERNLSAGRDHGANFRNGTARGDFFEHGRRFQFRRFWHGEWVFLNDWNGCTAWAWINVAPGIWAWRPIDVCIG